MHGEIAFDERSVLNIGCGKRIDPGAVNLDITEDTHPDVVHDLEVFPWPFTDNRFARIDAWDVVEHLSDTLAVINELHRILRPGGSVRMTMPHFSSANAFTDPTHRKFFAYKSFDYVTGAHFHDFYTRASFEMVRRRIHLSRTRTNRIVQRFVDRYPDRYEQRWAWIFPAWYLEFELQAVKPPA